jgi:hypothetical protein
MASFLCMLTHQVLDPSAVIPLPWQLDRDVVSRCQNTHFTRPGTPHTPRRFMSMPTVERRWRTTVRRPVWPHDGRSSSAAAPSAPCVHVRGTSVVGRPTVTRRDAEQSLAGRASPNCWVARNTTRT